MGHRRTDSGRRYTCAHLICAYLLTNHITRAVVTARDISQFHHLSWRSSRAISALLDFLYTNRIRETRFGFYILGTAPFLENRLSPSLHDRADRSGPGDSLMIPVNGLVKNSGRISGGRPFPFGMTPAEYGRVP